MSPKVLTDQEVRILAQLRLSTTLHLVAALGELVQKGALSEQGSLQEALQGPGFSLKLLVPGLPGLGLRFEAGDLRVTEGNAALWLVFPTPRACARVLAGGKGLTLPVPLGRAGLRGVRFFQRATQALPALLQSEQTPSVLKAQLLLTAALRGVEQVARLDPYVLPRLDHMRDGTVVVEVAGGPAMTVEKRGAGLEVRAGLPEGAPDARLTFRDAGVAVAVLAGKTSAVTALGGGSVAIRGFLPLVQGLFPVLDRLGWYLAATV